MAVVSRPGAGSKLAPAPVVAGSKIARVDKAVPGGVTGGGVVSLSPSTFTLGGGLLNDEDVQVTAAQFLLWDYEGKVATPVPALGITFRKLDEVNEQGEEFDHDQYYSCGDPQDWAPNGDGSGLTPLTGKTGLNANTNAGLLLASLVNVGVSTAWFDQIGGNIFALIGMQLHVNRVKQPDRNIDGGKKDKEVLLATKLLAMPGEGQGGGQTGPSKIKKPNGAPTPVARAATIPAPASAASATSPSDADPELDGAITEALIGILAENGGTLARKQVAPKIFSAFKDDPRKAQAMKRAGSEEYLQTAGDGVFTYDGATLTLAG